jgi:hypothetical protein
MKRSVWQTARRAGLDAQAGHRRERQERDRRIDALAVEVLVAIGERDAAERRAGELLQTMIDREQLSLRQAVAWLGGTITSVARPDCPSSRSLTRTGGVRVSGRRVDQTRLTALDPAVAGTSAIFEVCHPDPAPSRLHDSADPVNAESPAENGHV